MTIPNQNPEINSKPNNELPVLVDQVLKNTTPELVEQVTAPQQAASFWAKFKLPKDLIGAKQGLRKFGVTLGVIPKEKEFKRIEEIDHSVPMPPVSESDITEVLPKVNMEAVTARNEYKKKMDIAISIWNGLPVNKIQELLKIKQAEQIQSMYKPAENNTYNMSGTDDEGGVSRAMKNAKAEQDQIYGDDLQKEVTILRTILDKKQSEIEIDTKIEVGNPEAIKSQIKMRTKVAMDTLIKYGLKISNAHLNLPPATKIGLGVVMAGLSVGTAGVSTVAYRGLSLGSSALGIYHRELKKAEEKAKETGTEIVFDKWEAITKSVALGLIIGVVSPGAVDAITNQIPQEWKDFVTEKASAGVSNIVDWFKEKAPNLGSNPVQLVPVDTSIIPDTMPKPAQVTMPTTVEVASPVISEIPDSVKEKLLNPDSLVNISEYTVQNNDILEKVLMNRGFNADTLLDQKEKLSHIYNVLASDAGKALLAESGITDPNNIKVGQRINMGEFMQLLNK